MAKNLDDFRPKKRWRWLVGLLGLVVLLAVTLVAALPMYLNSSAGRRYLLQRSDLVLAPGRLEVASFHFSWFGPTRMTGFVLRDADGVAAVDAPIALWDRNLWQVLFDKLHRGKLDLQSIAERRASLNVRREADGSINLLQALKPILHGDSRTDVSVGIKDGSIELNDPKFSKPWTGQLRTLSVHIPSIPKPVAWDLSVVGPNAEMLAVRGTVDHPKPASAGESATMPDLAATIDLKSWPVDVARSGVSVHGLLGGDLAVAFKSGRWKTSGEASATNLTIGGKSLSGDTLKLARLQGAWDIGCARDFSEVRIALLNLHIPMGKLDIRGAIPPAPGASSLVAGTFDLAPLAAQLPHLFQTSERHALTGGVLHVKAETKGEPNTPASWTVRADVDGLSATVDGEQVALNSAATLRATLAPADAKGRLPLDVRFDMGDNPWLDGPVSLAVDGGYLSKSDRLELARVTFQSGDGDAELSGSIDRLTTKRDADLNARWTPNWEAINEILSRRIEPGANLEGGPITLRLLGSLSGLSVDEIPRELNAEIHAPITRADVYGLKVGAVDVAARSEKGHITIQPIETTLNGGLVHLQPTLDPDPDGDGMTARLGPESTIDDAQINDEVSHRVLSFLVPFMANATRANGTLDVQLSRAEFPIGSTAGRKTLVEGEVVFNNVEFAPGPMVEQLVAGLGPMGRGIRLQIVRLNHPVVLSIHDSKVYQHGLALPLGDVTEIAIDGSVGFDKTLDLKVTLPITTAMFGGPNPLEGGFGGNITKFSLPITGTLSKPKVDPDAFKADMRQTGRDLLQSGLLQGAGDLLDLLSRPRDPNAPPPLTAEQRREQRLEKKRERQLRREMRRNGGVLPIE